MRFFILTFSFFSILVSCSSTNKEEYSLVYDPSIKVEAPPILNKEKIDLDVNLVEYTLKNSYSGYFFKNKNNVELGIKKLKESVVNIESIKPGDFCNVLGESFSHVQDEHLTFQFGPRKCARNTFVGNVGKRIDSEEKRLWTVKKVVEGNSNVLVITISWFASPSSNKWDGMLREIKTHLDKIDFVVVDLRGNSGGDDTIGYQLAKLLTGGSQFSTPYANQYKVVTRPGLESRANLSSFLAYNAESKKQKDFFTDFIKRDKQKYTNYKQETAIVNKVLPKVVKAKALRPVVILQDRACASSCESTIDFFEYIDDVTRVGENTAGQVQFGNLGFVVLPESRIQINIPSTFNSYRDNRFIESIGIKPDVNVPKGQDAYDFAITYMKNRRK
ncbi:S41 family peptidase [Halobacteriovorax sp. RZ-1]|uniref:S41 family peptidase n=1 Tax=unclassified Halobacteriovorax TaxID=2639665 RepID=UPI003719E064